MMTAAEQKQERRFLQLDRRYASTKPTQVRTEATKLVNKAITVKTPLAISHTATHNNSAKIHNTSNQSLFKVNNSHHISFYVWRQILITEEKTMSRNAICI